MDMTHLPPMVPFMRPGEMFFADMVVISPLMESIATANGDRTVTLSMTLLMKEEGKTIARMPVNPAIVLRSGMARNTVTDKEVTVVIFMLSVEQSMRYYALFLDPCDKPLRRYFDKFTTQDQLYLSIFDEYNVPQRHIRFNNSLKDFFRFVLRTVGNRQWSNDDFLRSLDDVVGNHTREEIWHMIGDSDVPTI